LSKAAGGGCPPLPREFKVKRWFMGRVPKGADLASYLDEFVRDRDIRSGALGVIGVVSAARLGFFDIQAGDYVVTRVDGHREIASSVGNVSLRDGQPAVHVHLVVSDREGRTTGGHLMEGTVVHYAEFWIAVVDGPAFERGHDPETNVTGWVR